MGRYSAQLAPGLADLAGVAAGQKALDVGCGPGALTSELVRRLGADAVAAARERHPGVDVRLASAEELPYAVDTFDVALAQLVVHFMRDPVAGLTELTRVTRPGGVVAACVWDFERERAPLSPFWRAALELDLDTDDESQLAGARAGHLAELFERAGVRDVRDAELSASARFESFDEWWQPFTLGVGPAGAHAQSLDAATLAELRERCRRSLGDGPFALDVTAW